MAASEEKQTLLLHLDKFKALAPEEVEDASSPDASKRGFTRKGSKEHLLQLEETGTKVSSVERSWYLISDRIGDVGLKFFLRMFDEHPDLIRLFPFSEDSVHPQTGKLVLNARTEAHVRAHATAVMRVVGTCVAGLTSIEDLIPRLRHVGETHKTVGVQSLHYDILYRSLVRAIREEVGPQNWDEETEDAWEEAYRSITDLIKRPSKRLETEPLRGWGLMLMMACAYFALVTPFRFAGFLYGNEDAVILLNVLDGIGALILALDLAIDLMFSQLRINRFGKSSPVFRALNQQRRSLVRWLQAHNMDRWVPWPSMDLKVLLSFPLQWLFVRTSICAQLGLHWTQLFGLIRTLTVVRVLHFMQCAENNAMLEQKLDADRQMELRVTKLLLRLGFIIHVSACLWCTIARVGLGSDATEFTPSAFFAEDILFTSDNIMNSYSRAIHWAFVNLSGIGNVDSVPTSTLECWFTLMVHMIGAIFYAVVTGVLITILEESSQKDGKIGTEILKLSEYMTSARVSSASKDRIMKGT